LRREDAELDGELDRLGSEEEVRRTLADFNERVVAARRQLQGGPPVITKTRDADVEVQRWNDRRAARAAAAPPELEPEAKRRWWRRFWTGSS
jgi:hypothetical protein